MAYGGHGNGKGDDSDAIMRAFRACGEGGRILLPGSGWKPNEHHGGFVAESMVPPSPPCAAPRVARGRTGRGLEAALRKLVASQTAGHTR